MTLAPMRHLISPDQWVAAQKLADEMPDLSEIKTYIEEKLSKTKIIITFFLKHTSSLSSSAQNHQEMLQQFPQINEKRSYKDKNLALREGIDKWVQNFAKNNTKCTDLSPFVYNSKRFTRSLSHLLTEKKISDIILLKYSNLIYEQLSNLSDIELLTQKHYVGEKGIFGKYSQPALKIFYGSIPQQLFSPDEKPIVFIINKKILELFNMFNSLKNRKKSFSHRVTPKKNAENAPQYTKLFFLSKIYRAIQIIESLKPKLKEKEKDTETFAKFLFSLYKLSHHLECFLSYQINSSNDFEVLKKSKSYKLPFQVKSELTFKKMETAFHPKERGSDTNAHISKGRRAIVLEPLRLLETIPEDPNSPRTSRTTPRDDVIIARKEKRKRRDCRGMSEKRPTKRL